MAAQTGIASFTAVSLLGGASILHAQPQNPADWIPLVRHGLPALSIEAFMSRTELTHHDLAQALKIPERTLSRRKQAKLLNPEESDKLLRLVRVVARAAEVFEDGPAGLDWLKTPNTSLGGVTPLSLLDTELGAETVMDTLGRIEHGVFD